MKKLLTLTAITASLVSGASMALTPTGDNFNDTGDILARSKQHTDIEPSGQERVDSCGQIRGYRGRMGNETQLGAPQIRARA